MFSGSILKPNFLIFLHRNLVNINMVLILMIGALFNSAVNIDIFFLTLGSQILEINPSLGRLEYMPLSSVAPDEGDPMKSKIF